MSTVIVESPSVGSQLYFPWIAPAEAPVDEPQNRPASQACKEPVDRQYQPDLAGTQSLSFQGDRIARPVRIGTVMIKLLKKYGITDAEITEGLQNYAEKACNNIAS